MSHWRDNTGTKSVAQSNRNKLDKLCSESRCRTTSNKNDSYILHCSPKCIMKSSLCCILCRRWDTKQLGNLLMPIIIWAASILCSTCTKIVIFCDIIHPSFTNDCLSKVYAAMPTCQRSTHIHWVLLTTIIWLLRVDFFESKSSTTILKR